MAGLGASTGVATVQGSQHEVVNLLRADGDDGFRFRVEFGISSCLYQSQIDFRNRGMPLEIE